MMPRVRQQQQRQHQNGNACLTGKAGGSIMPRLPQLRQHQNGKACLTGKAGRSIMPGLLLLRQHQNGPGICYCFGLTQWACLTHVQNVGKQLWMSITNVTIVAVQYYVTSAPCVTGVEWTPEVTAQILSRRCTGWYTAPT